MIGSVDLCPLCNDVRHELFETYQDTGHTLFYQLCTKCGLVFQSPRMDESALESFYASGYRQFIQGTEEITEKDLRIQAGRARHQLSIVKQFIPTVSCHLDIGSSSGALLRYFNGFYGCESVGIEPGTAYREKSRASGQEIYADLKDLDPRWFCSFDLVSMSHVLEHLPDPLAYLAQLRERWMTPDGYLLIEVPNLFYHQAVELSHLILFSPRTLQQLLSLTGFKLLKLITHGEPRSPILRLYITALARACPDVQSIGQVIFTSQGIREKRAIGKWMRTLLSRMLPGLTWRALPKLEKEF